MKKRLLIFGLLISAAFFTACEMDDESNIKTYKYHLTVASELKHNAFHPYGSFMGYSPTSLWVKAMGETEWNTFSTAIEGFQYEPGYEYKIVVKGVLDTRIMDGGLVYSLESIGSKTQKISEGIPASKSYEIKKMTVASQKYNSSEGSYFLVKFDPAGLPSRMNITPASQWQVFYGEIEGFVYVPGNEYDINISYDDFNWRGSDDLPLFTLVDVVRSDEIDSEGLPR